MEPPPAGPRQHPARRGPVAGRGWVPGGPYRQHSLRRQRACIRNQAPLGRQWARHATPASAPCGGRAPTGPRPALGQSSALPGSGSARSGSARTPGRGVGRGGAGPREDIGGSEDRSYNVTARISNRGGSLTFAMHEHPQLDRRVDGHQTERSRAEPSQAGPRGLGPERVLLRCTRQAA